jgi:hypothetical protein
LAPWLKLPPVREKIEKIRKKIGLDPTTDLHSITLYGDDLKPDRAVLIVRSQVDRPTLMAFLADQPNYAVEKLGQREMLTWTDRSAGGRHKVFAAMHGPTQMVFARRAEDLEAALAALEGTRPRLAASAELLRDDTPEGTVLLLRARDLDAAKVGLKSPILKLSEMLTVLVGERDGQAFIEARLRAKSAEHLREFREVAEGLVALARLLRAEDDDVLALLEQIEIRTEERTVAARWSGEVDELLPVIIKQHARITAKRSN